MKRIYLAGPISLNGQLEPGAVAQNIERFKAAAEQLRAKGFHVENPAENEDTVPPRTWESWMRLSLSQLLTCDEVWLLPNWEQSRGARMEWRIADALGMDVHFFEAVLS